MPPQRRGCKPLISRCLRYTSKTLISYDDAIKNAESENDLRLNIKLHGKDAKLTEFGETMEDVSIEADDDPNASKLSFNKLE